MKVLVIDDEAEDLSRFGEVFDAYDCPTLRLSTFEVNEERDNILNFGPDLAVVDSSFGDNDLEGLTVITKLQKIVPRIHVIVCSKFADNPTKKRWFEKRYQDVPHVRGTIGKIPFPTAQQILSFLE
jgi:hypothetical protein